MDVAVIGLGLIGGSLLRALAAGGHRVIGYDADPATRAMARTAAAQAPAAARWEVAKALSDTLRRADIVAIATPLPAVGKVLDQIVAAGYSGLVTDAVSVKQPVRELVNQRERLFGYVGGHPMAGRERAGFASADAELFRGCAWVLCLDAETDLGDWLTMATVATGLGVRVVPTTAIAHDEAVATVSHVPHLLASALSRAAAVPLAGTLAAGSFRDGTRVAASPPGLIAAMCGGNSGPVLAALDALLAELAHAREALLAEDPVNAVRAWAQPGHDVRSSWPRGWGAPVTIPARPKELLSLGETGGWVTAVSADRRTVTAVRPV
ncbi:prephenate dehydrogenase/arogenate dehydrogenase family protein [Luedemannella helvata]|uniref:Prephenate dehydrogenase n=1 Tax=Luedemannella helvata TaxID=349315 RepID=A0ABP4W9P8_9ACTN